MPYAEKPWLKSFAPGVPGEITQPEVTFVDHWDKFIKETADQPVAYYLGTTLTHRDLYNHANRMAQALKSLGLGKGDVVGVCLPNTPQYLITVLGALKAGCAVSGVSPLMSPHEMSYQLNDCGAKAFIILDLLFESTFAGIADKVPGLKTVIPTGLIDMLPGFKQVLARLLKKVPTGRITPLSGKDLIPFKQILKRYSSESPGVSISLDDPCFYQYTGGTTGLPKGAVLTHGNIISNMFQLQAIYKFEKGKDIFCSGLPMFHIAGLIVSMLSPYFGTSQVIIPDPRNTDMIIKQIETYSPTVYVNVPTLYLMLLQNPKFKEIDWSPARVFFSGAAPFSEDGVKALESVIGKGKVRELYGMTETSPGIGLDQPGLPKRYGSIGLPMPSTDVRVVDAVTGESDVPIGQAGELWVSGPQVMKEYHNKPEETARVFVNENGRRWLRTGDVVRMDEDGFIYIVDRAKDMIIVSGYKVFSTELENVMSEHPAVEMCAAVGVENPERSETEMVKLIVQTSLEYKDKADEEVKIEILNFAREKLAPYKVPKIIEFREMPLTAVGKIDKKQLR